MNSKVFMRAYTGGWTCADDCTGTLSANYGSNHWQYVAYLEQSGRTALGFKYHQGAGARDIGFEREICPTLTADFHQPAVIVGGEVG